MATIANLGVSLTARIGNFEKGFKRAQKIAKRFGRDLKRHLKTITGYGAAVAAVATGALSMMVKQQLSAIDSTNKLSRVLGVQTETLTGLYHAAELAGIEQGTVTSTMQALIKRVGEARSETGPLITFFKKYDQTLLGAIKQTTNADQALALVADAIKGAANEADAAAIANAAFSRTGVRMTEIFRELGSDAIPKARREAEEIGFAFSAVDGSKVEQANDAITRASRAVTGLARRITIQLAPYIEAVANRFRNMAVEGEISGETTTNAINQVLKALGKMVDMFELLKATWNSFVAVVTGAAWALLQPLRSFASGLNKVMQMVGMDGMSNINQFFDDLSEGFKEASVDASEKAGKAFEKFNEGFHSKNAEVFFEGIKRQAEKAGESLNNMSIPSVDDIAGSAAASQKAGEFRQVDLSRIAVGGLSSPRNKPMDRQQGQTMISSLREIANNTRTGQAVVT